MAGARGLADMDDSGSWGGRREAGGGWQLAELPVKHGLEFLGIFCGADLAEACMEWFTTAAYYLRDRLEPPQVINLAAAGNGSCHPLGPIFRS